MFQIYSKLKHVKATLKQFNKRDFADIEVNIVKNRKLLEDFQLN